MDRKRVHDIESLRQENAFLHARIAGLESHLYAIGRPVLDIDPAFQSGYLRLEREERRFTTFALSEHIRSVRAWYRYLTLLEKAVENANQNPVPNFSDHHQLAIHFLCVSSGTAKVVLDTGLAGYYAQSLALTRHLFETWLRLAYVGVRPELAKAWFVQKPDEDPRPPTKKIVPTLLATNDESLKATVLRVCKTIKKLNLMAHPSHQTFQQTVGATENTFNFGANYEPELALYFLHEGSNALRLNLLAMNDFFPQPVKWFQEFREVESEIKAAIEHEEAVQNERRMQTDGTKHWILESNVLSSDESQSDSPEFEYEKSYDQTDND